MNKALERPQQWHVSIQLMSPASGNSVNFPNLSSAFNVSIQLMSPASGNLEDRHSGTKLLRGVSIQLMSPASGNHPTACLKLRLAPSQVSIQLMSPASGNSFNIICCSIFVN